MNESELNLISLFLKTGDFIETNDVNNINSLSSYIIYIINLNQKKNLFLSIEYKDFINTIKANKSKLSSIRLILNLIEPYKLKVLNDLIPETTTNKIENIEINDINFNIKDIYDSYLDFINKDKDNIKYSNFIFSSNKQKNYLIDLDKVKNESYFYYITNYKNLSPNTLRLTDKLISDNSYIISNSKLLNEILMNDLKFNNITYKRSYVDLQEKQIDSSFIFKSFLNLQIKLAIYFNNFNKIYIVKLISKHYKPPNLNESIGINSIFDEEINTIFFDINSYKYYLHFKKQIFIVSEISFELNEIKRYLYDTIKEKFIEKVIKNHYNSFNINFDLTNVNKIKFNKNDLLYFNNFNIIDMTTKKNNQYSNSFITKFVIGDKSCYKKTRNFYLHDLLRL